MTQFLIAVATLCITPTGSTINTYNRQLRCQQEYLKCVEKKKGDIDYRLRECVLEKKET